MNTKEIHEMFGAVKKTKMFGAVKKTNLYTTATLGMPEYKYQARLTLGTNTDAYINYMTLERPTWWRRVLQRLVLGLKWEKL